MNFINLLCYNVNKTVEFRLLRPTYNFEKIKLWLYIFNAILVYAENLNNDISKIATIKDLIRKVYPESISDLIVIGIIKLRSLITNQTNNGDQIGHDIEFDDEIFSNDLGI